MIDDGFRVLNYVGPNWKKKKRKEKVLDILESENGETRKGQLGKMTLQKGKYILTLLSFYQICLYIYISVCV